MSRDNLMKEAGTYFGYVAGAPTPIAVGIASTAATTSGAATVTVKVALPVPTGMVLQILGVGITGTTIAASTTVKLGVVGALEVYLTSKTVTGGGGYFPCDGVSANSRTKSVVFVSPATEFTLTVNKTADTWVDVTAYVWVVPIVLPTDVVS